jgi:hypothetical protein
MNRECTNLVERVGLPMETNTLENTLPFLIRILRQISNMKMNRECTNLVERVGLPTTTGGVVAEHRWLFSLRPVQSTTIRILGRSMTVCRGMAELSDADAFSKLENTVGVANGQENRPMGVKVVEPMAIPIIPIC